MSEIDPPHNPNNLENSTVEPVSVPPAEIPSKPRKPRYSNDKANRSHGNRYSVTQRLAIRALKDSGMSEREAQPIAGVSRNTITRIWEDPELDDLSPQVVTRVKSGLGGLFYKRSLQALLAMTPDKYQQASLLQIATTSGIMIDKARIIEGLSTENISFRGITENLESDRSKIMEKLAELE